MPKDLYGRRARIHLGHRNDADTITFETDSAYGGRQENPLRLYACYMPELKDPGGPQMRQVMLDWIAAADYSLDWPFWVDSKKTKVREPGQKMTFARYLSLVWHFDGGDTVGPPLNDVLTAVLEANPQWGRGIGGAA